MNSSFPLGVKQSTNQEKPRRIMKDFRFLGGRWAYGLLKWSEKVETFFLLTKKKSGISKKKNQKLLQKPQAFVTSHVLVDGEGEVEPSIKKLLKG